MRRILIALALVLAAMLAGGSASAHGDNCIIAIHVGGIRIHPACG